MTGESVGDRIKGMREFLETRHGKIWSRIHRVPKPKAIVVSYGGSGEYRTVDTWADDRLAAWLNDHSYSVLSFDKWGCGESEGDWKRVTLDILMETGLDVVERVKDSSPVPIFYLGQSEGSKLGFEIAARTKACGAFALRVPSHQGIEERLKYQILEMNRDAQAWEIWRHGIEEIKAQLASGAEIEGFLYNFPATFWASALGRPQPADLAPSIPCPLFVLNGDEDPFTPPAAFQEIHKALASHPHPLSKAKVYAGVGHGLRPEGEPWVSSEAAVDIIKWFDLVCDS